MVKNIVMLFFLILGVQMMQANTLSYLTINNIKIPVISEQSSVIPTGYLEVIFMGGGNMFNPPKKPLAKIASEMLNRGTKTLGNVKFAELLESKALDLDVGVGQVTLTFTLNFLKEYEDFAYTQLENLIKDPNLTKSTLQDVQKKLHAALMSKSSDFDYQATLLLQKGIFAKTPLAYPALGNTTQEIDSVTLNDVKNYLDTTLVLENMVLVIGGDLDIKTSLTKLEKIFSLLPQGKKVVIPQYKVKTIAMKTAKKDTQQAYIYFASPLNLQSIKDDAYKAQVAGFILGSSGFGSRLMEEIRVKRGLAYSAYMRPNIARTSTYVAGYMQTALDKQDEAIALTQQIVKDFVEKGVTQEELDSAKQFILGNKPLQEETLGQRLNARFMNYYNGLPLDYRDEFLQKVASLDLQTLNDFIRAHAEIADLSFAVITK
ncbi:pitrilysin family protein [Helicobacter trogontum]|uniref:Insulinase family protein n=2 Tax=Helicobacter trogontum TaxID=50960 RepID=A0A4V6I3D9_9HELI|nr:pitrilysin family protein [Helicobacter trogontum]MCI5787434.1 insulinase family protein [Helicobacter trogontum]MDY5184447.1 pitrilysin family protein [Helicobacter trogontum]TLD99692.1 insulinase family protein [Helicobacter trogontum]